MAQFYASVFLLGMIGLSFVSIHGHGAIMEEKRDLLGAWLRRAGQLGLAKRGKTVTRDARANYEDMLQEITRPGRLLYKRMGSVRPQREFEEYLEKVLSGPKVALLGLKREGQDQKRGMPRIMLGK